MGQPLIQRYLAISIPAPASAIKVDRALDSDSMDCSSIDASQGGCSQGK